MAKLKTESISPTTPAAAPKDSAPQTHSKECGDVGITGEHGDLGTNAAK